MLDQWGGEPDRLNPKVTQLFIEKTHERYAVVVGERFGKEIRAIFTDEPKWNSYYPWTAEMFPSFKQRFGYDLPPRLWQLFSTTTDESSMLTRLHYYQWCAERLRIAWFGPVSTWCRSHHLALVGHVSPEDDPERQAQCIGNLFPIFSYFQLPGFDLIIPAVGDRRNPLINIGVLSATSASQQLERPGVLSEALACSGPNFTVDEAARILRWHLMMGVTTPVIHCAYNSAAGLRSIDAPPDFGPESPLWPGMIQLNKEFSQLQPIVTDAVQVAPVAVLWPIRSFAAMPIAEDTFSTSISNTTFSLEDRSPLRNNLVQTIQTCLDHQVGLHILDEADLWRAKIDNRQITLGKAVYSHVLIPSCTVLHERSMEMLQQAIARGVIVIQTGQPPTWQQCAKQLQTVQIADAMRLLPVDAIEQLPKSITIEPDGTDIRCTVWRHDGKQVRLLMSLRTTPALVTVDGEPMNLLPGKIYTLQKK